MRPHRVPCAMLICLAFICSANSFGQRQQLPSQTGGGTVPTTDMNEAAERAQREQAKKANAARQAALKNDTDKLVKLALELKNSVDKSNENVLSLEVLKKADEIEKLAHSVKDKMKGPI